MIIKPRVEIAVSMAKRCSQGLKTEALSGPICSKYHPLPKVWSVALSDEVPDRAKRLRSNSAPVQRLIVVIGADEKKKSRCDLKRPQRQAQESLFSFQRDV